MTHRTPSREFAPCDSDSEFLPLNPPRDAWPALIERAAAVLRGQPEAQPETFATLLTDIAASLRRDRYAELVEALRDCMEAARLHGSRATDGAVPRHRERARRPAQHRGCAMTAAEAHSIAVQVARSLVSTLADSPRATENHTAHASTSGIAAGRDVHITIHVHGGIRHAGRDFRAPGGSA